MLNGVSHSGTPGQPLFLSLFDKWGIWRSEQLKNLSTFKWSPYIKSQAIPPFSTILEFTWISLRTVRLSAPLQTSLLTLDESLNLWVFAPSHSPYGED